MDPRAIRNMTMVKGPGSMWDVVGIVIYLGDRPLSFGSKMFAFPLSTFWAFSEA